MNKIVCVTGATSGIGEATSLLFAKHGFDLIITGRRADRLKGLADKILEYKVNVCPLTFDVRDRIAVEEAVNSLEGKWKNIDVLVNNAGLSVGLNSLQEGIHDDWERMIDTNIKGLLYITRCVVPFMIANRKGHIINIGSIAGKETYPNGNVYCATKHAVDSLTEGMRIDLLQHNIKVTQVAPGAVETEFSLVRFKGNKEKADLVYKGFKPLQAEDIADVIFFAATRPSHVNINDLLIMPTAQASAVQFNKSK